ncbi:hypothetical protein [Paraburkholderia pallida]|uniref:Uncharacterized protein n=1 Tax=Paraburkholderia pallida TaxID=2547399 RepID=A0A4P7D8J8_9BURK|nr:hypothetical protein [Paraburkholderia pallida]QBR03490.1 hypothetical protein E1956_40940 [Paraburkholderia pallida]
MALYGVSGLAILMLLSLVLTVPLLLVLAALGFSRSMRERKFWWRSVPILVCLLPVQVLVMLNAGALEDGYDRAVLAWYTHHLTRTTVLDGMTFPPGSTVVQHDYSPHSVASGTVPVGTSLLGLTVIGDFMILQTDDHVNYLAEGTLAKPGSLAGIQCAPGSFTQKKRPAYDVAKTIETVECTLASEYQNGEFDFPPGTHVKADVFDRSELLSISGALPREWRIFGLQCDKGPFESDDGHRFSCTLAADQRLGQYLFSRGEELMVSRDPDGSLRIYGRH